MATSRTFAVPAALSDTNEVVRPTEAVRGHSYRCPGCSQPLVLRRGKLKASHFAHKTAIAGCSLAAVLRRTARRILVHSVEAWRTGQGPQPVIQRGCIRSPDHVAAEQRVPEKVDGAHEQVQLESGHHLDVALVSDGTVVAGLLVVVDSEEDGPEDLPVPWIQVRAVEAIEEPTVWRAVRDAMRPVACSVCLAEEEALRELRRTQGRSAYGELAPRLHELREFCRRQGLFCPPSPPYFGAVLTCYRCDQPTVAYRWNSGSWSDRPPPQPRPPSVRVRGSRTAGSSYWANTCHRCGALLGDFYLHSEPDSPLFGLDELLHDISEWLRHEPADVVATLPCLDGVPADPYLQ